MAIFSTCCWMPRLQFTVVAGCSAGQQVVDAAAGAAAGGVGIQVSVEGGAESHRRIAVGVHGRALQVILEHAGAAANGGFAGAEDIPGEADAGRGTSDR